MRSLRGLSTVAIASWIVAVSCAASDPYDPASAQLDAEIARLEGDIRKLESGGLSDAFTGGLKEARERAAEARATSSALLKMLRTRDLFIAVESLRFVAGHPSAGEDIGRLEELWKERSVDDAKGRTTVSGSVVARGLQQAAFNRASRLYKASLPYGRISSPLSGVYYLGEAQANRRFGEFIGTLQLPDAAENAPAREQLAVALDGLEREVLARFAADQTNANAIPVSMRLKESRELLESGLLEGATLLILETRAELSRRMPPLSPQPRTAAAVEPPSDSITELWKAIASEDASRREVVEADVLPMYASLRRNR